MSKRKKSKKKATTTKMGGTIVYGPDKYENHPFFVKQAEEALEFLKRVGLPKEFKNISLD